MALRGSIRIFSQRDKQRVDRKGQNSGHLCGQAQISDNRINHLRLRCGSWRSHQLSQIRNVIPSVGRPRVRKNRFMMATVRSTPAAGQARRRGVAVSRSLPGFILGPLQLEDARVSPIRDLGQNLQVVAPEALRHLPRPAGVAVDPGVERADRRWQVQACRFRNPLPCAPAPLPEERFCQTDYWNGSSSSGR